MPPLIDPVDLDMFFAKSKPIVVTFMWTPLSVQVVDDTSTLAHRCRYGCGRPSHWCRMRSGHRGKGRSRPRGDGRVRRAEAAANLRSGSTCNAGIALFGL